MTPRNEREAHSLMGAATDSEIEHWIAAAERKEANATDHRLRALALVLVGWIVATSVVLMVRSCA